MKLALKRMFLPVWAVKKIALLAIDAYSRPLGGAMFLDTRLKHILSNAKSIAIVGAKDKEGQPVDRVGRYLMAAGYTVLPVHPKRENVWGLTTYKSLAEIPYNVDIINLFRASSYCGTHAQELLTYGLKPQCFWMQEGIFSPEAGAILADKPIHIVENLCIKIVHQQLFGV